MPEIKNRIPPKPAEPYLFPVMVFFIGTGFFFFLGVIEIFPGNYKPVRDRLEFTAGTLKVDSFEYVAGSRGGHATTYAVGNINGIRHPLKLESGFEERQLWIARGTSVPVYYHPGYKKVYFRWPTDPSTTMPYNTVFTPFIFWFSILTLPFLICTTLLLFQIKKVVRWRRWKAEMKEFTKQQEKFIPEAD